MVLLTKGWGTIQYHHVRRLCMLHNWTQLWGMDLPAFDWLNPVEGPESIIKKQFAVADNMVDSLCRCMDMSVWQDTTATMANSWQSAADALAALSAMALTDETAAATTEEMESLKAENQAFSEQIASYKKEVAQLKRTNTLHKKAIDQYKEGEIEQHKTVAAKDKEIVSLKKALDQYKEREIEQHKTVAAKDKEIFSLKKAIDQYKEREIEQRKTVVAKDKEIFSLKKELSKKPVAASAPKRVVK